MIRGSHAKPLPVNIDVVTSALDKVGEGFPSVASSVAQWVTA